MQYSKFIIPEYQRPYKWDLEKCDTLWQDLTGFFGERITTEKYYLERKINDEYYLGTVVTCKNDESEKKEIEVIDGQQRITSLLLLLRAFYTKLEKSTIENDVNILGLKNQIAPCIWDVDSISGRVSDKKKIHIESRVATESDNAVFHDILKTGQAKPGATDLYSKNYQYFFKQCEEYAKSNPTHWQGFCVFILRNCIILPIDCEKLDTALTIFSTLNDRGMPLSDSDIFKAKIYGTKKTDPDKSEFTKAWIDLTETVEKAGISLNDLFRNYSHVIRGRNGDKTKEIGLRKFYAGSGNKFSKLKQTSLMKELGELADFWLMVEEGNNLYQERLFISEEAFEWLHCLTHYPNEYWKYVTSAFFFKYKDSGSFYIKFPIYLGTIISDNLISTSSEFL